MPNGDIAATGAASFLPGLDLNQQFFQELIQPLLAEHLPQLEYAAALIGTGSDVLGYDTPRSMDHGWGPRLKLLLPETPDPSLQRQLNELWQTHLPRQFRGFALFYLRHRSGSLVPITSDLETRGQANHPEQSTLIEVQGAADFFRTHLGQDPAQELSTADWLSFSEQALLEMTAGAVYYDPNELLKARRERLRYFPDEIWRYRLASQWQELAEMEAFPGRCAELGDELGQQLLITEIVRWAGHLWFLLRRRYRPYAKWWGTALKNLLADKQYAHLQQILEANGYSEQEAALGVLYGELAQAHNQLQLTPQISPELQPYYDRPFQVLFAGRFAQALQQSIADPELRQLPLYGGADQISAQTLLLSEAHQRAKLQALWQS